MQSLALLALAASAIAHPKYSLDPIIHPFVPPGHTDSRSPCPMLNSLANHGYLPRDGRDITIQMIADAMPASVNWSKDYGLIPGQTMFDALGRDVIDLGDLFNRTAGTEHVASLARPNDSDAISRERVLEVLADSPDPDYIDAASLATTLNRLAAEEAPPASAAGSILGEAAFTIFLALDGPIPAGDSTCVDRKALKAFKDRAEVFLVEERFPFELGWKPSRRQVQFADLAPMAEVIAAAQAADQSE